MSAPETECPHLATRSIDSYHWRHTYCVDCGAEWRSPLPPYTEQETTK